MIPGEILPGTASIEINKGLKVKKLHVVNCGSRPIQVGSHIHFFEVNKFLKFDRKEAYGFRLDIPSGTAIRFEPDEDKTVDLVELAGNKRVRGINNLTDAQINDTTLKASLEKAGLKDFI
ncbi:MAG: urease subunit beta [Fibrobacteraceae bacterium]